MTALHIQIQWSITTGEIQTEWSVDVHCASQHVATMGKTLRGWHHQPSSQSAYTYGKSGGRLDDHPKSRCYYQQYYLEHCRECFRILTKEGVQVLGELD